MNRTLTVTSAASDLHLLSIEEMRSAAGVTGSGQDTALQAFGLTVAAAITSECKVATGEGAEPTLKRETLRETFRQVDIWHLFLSRRHGVDITSITVDGTALEETEFEVAAESGKLTFLVEDEPAKWVANKVVVVYAAGFTTIPGDLKMAASDFFRLGWLEKSRDPSLKSQEIDIPGVERVRSDYVVGVAPGQGMEGAVPSVVAGQLQRFRVYGL